MKTWSDGSIIEGKALIDSFSFPLHYGGPAVWEGLRSYVQDDGTCRIFKLKEHVARLRESAKILGYVIPFSDDDVAKACEELVQLNGNGDLYLRPIAYMKADAEGIHAPKSKELSLDIYCVPIPKLHRDSDGGIRMVTSGFVRGYPQHNMQAKTPGNYASLSMIESLLAQTGCQDAFLVDNQGYFVEATVANFFVVKGDVIMTPPNKGSILCGITRRTVAEILGNSSLMFSKYLKVPRVVEKDITKADIYTADEVFLTGTYAEIVPVVEVDSRSIGSGSAGYYTKLVQQEYARMIRGSK